MGQQVEARFLLRDEFSAGLSHIKAGLKDMSRLGGAAGGLMGMLGGAASIYGVAQLGKELLTLGRQGADVLELGDNFAATAARMGQSSDVMLARFRTMTKGTIDNQALMQIGSKLMLNGLAGDMNKLGQLYQIADARADSLGRDTKQAFDAMADALNTGRIAALADLGFDLAQLSAGVDSYAAGLGKSASALSDVEKRQALLNAVLQAGAGELANVGNQALSDADKIARMEASVKNAKDALAKLVAPAVAGVADAVTNALAAPMEKALRAAENDAKRLSGDINAVRGSLDDAAVSAYNMDMAFVGANTTTWAQNAEQRIKDLENEMDAATAKAWGLRQALEGMSGGAAFLGGASAPRKLGSQGDANNAFAGAAFGVLGSPGKSLGDLAVAANATVAANKKQEEATKRLTEAYDNAASKMRGRIEGILFSPSQVSAGEMFTARQGGTTPLHADETIRRLRAAIQNGSAEWQYLIPAEVRGMDQAGKNLWLQSQEEKFYAGGAPEMVNWEGFKQQYQAQILAEQNKEALIQRAMQELGPGANKGAVKQALGVADYGDYGAQMANGFELAVAGMNPAQLLASRFTSDLAANKKLLETAGAGAWNTIIASLDKADTSPLNALAARIAPMVAGINSWNGNTNAGANP